jgi:hypothetical protein
MIRVPTAIRKHPNKRHESRKRLIYGGCTDIKRFVVNRQSAGFGFPYFLASLCFALLCTTAEAKENADSFSSDGGRYHGTFVNGMRHGQGKLDWTNGARYEGGFENGLFSGKGKYKFASGDVYEGDFRNGMMEGNGRLTHADGSVYVGQFKGDHFHGQGEMKSPDGYIYKGIFSKGQQTGHARLTSPQEEYVGNFKNGQYSGHGRWKHSDGRKYEGNFVRNHYHGQGKYTSASGDIYEGSFIKGEFTGKGTFKTGGTLHRGNFVNWYPQGQGSFTDPKGNVYEGNFEQGSLNGKGRMIGKDGSRYEGEFEHWKYHGKGTYTSKDGDLYEGGFSYGRFDGEGIYRYASPQKDGSTLKKGTWQYGNLVDKEAERKKKARIENALYSQSTLLSNTLSKVKKQEPGKIDLYLLAVGGDGSQEVFRRETEFVKTQFDRDFGTEGRSVVLVNSRETGDTLPMATVTSVQKSLQDMASKMDRQQDILFLFLTSHGSKKHDFILSQDGMDIRHLGAPELSQLLRETGIRWKVIVVSACYSGGFIEPLKDENTLIMTASRHDRSSFGCADENDFTYFGKAFFHDALPGEKSFESAFEKAKLLIRQREEKDFAEQDKTEKNEHSEPQIHSPLPITQHLQRWQNERKKAGENVQGVTYAR